MINKGIRLIKFQDKLATILIKFGGIIVIIAVLGILAVIMQVALPLFYSSQAQLAHVLKHPTLTNHPLLMAGLDDYTETAFAVNNQGQIFVFDLNSKQLQKTVTLQHPTKQTIPLMNVQKAGHHYVLTWQDKAISVVSLGFKYVFNEAGHRVNQFKTTIETTFLANPAALLSIARYYPEQGSIRIDALPGNQIAITRYIREEASLFGKAENKVFNMALNLPAQTSADITAFEVADNGDKLYVGLSDGTLLYWQLQEEQAVLQGSTRTGSVDAKLTAGNTKNSGIASMQLLAGNETLLVGHPQGSISAWFQIPRSESRYASNTIAPTQRDATHVLGHIHTLNAQHEDATQWLVSGNRNRIVMSTGVSGQVDLMHVTSTRPLLSINTNDILTKPVFSPRDDSLIAITQQNQLIVYHLNLYHPESSWKSYFQSIWYEGYAKPSHVWQSSAADDDFEPKFGLMPLVVGSLKGAFYGLLVAAPVGLLCAIYTSQFMNTGMRGWVKPIFEIIGSSPTVVLGFLAAFWLAPLLDRYLTSMVVMLVGLLPSVLFSLFVCQMLTRKNIFKINQLRGYEFVILIPVIALVVFLAFWIGQGIDHFILQNTLNNWLSLSAGLQITQRNAIVISWILGFAVLPLVFTIADDALGNVPRRLTAASLALGASRWQTVWRVVVPSAGAGLFAAIMVGLGRAAGETMIVLMATGNTPLLEMSPFTGMRTLAANIAVEIPEAPHGETLYRTLFMSAALLFVFTFFLNSIAEVIRSHLRKKFGSR